MHEKLLELGFEYEQEDISMYHKQVSYNKDTGEEVAVTIDNVEGIAIRVGNEDYGYTAIFIEDSLENIENIINFAKTIKGVE